MKTLAVCVQVLKEDSKAVKAKRLVLRLVKTILGLLLLSIGARAKIMLPFTPVPLTLQTLFLAYIIFTLKEEAWRSVAAYLLAGLLGAPVFAYGGGLHYLLSPTFGYLLGFLASAYIVGRSVEPLYLKKLVKLAALMQAVIYLLGFGWLTAWYWFVAKRDLSTSLFTAFMAGVVPFIAWDSLKAVIAGFMVYSTRRAYSRIKGSKIEA